VPGTVLFEFQYELLLYNLVNGRQRVQDFIKQNTDSHIITIGLRVIFNKTVQNFKFCLTEAK
jgi:hypothetical protein